MSLSFYLVRLSNLQKIWKIEENVSLKQETMNNVAEVARLKLPQSYLIFILLSRGAEDKRIKCYITC